MGIVMSFVMGKGNSSTQVLNILMSTLSQQFFAKTIKNEEDFQKAILDVFNTVNSALPGKHYDVPSHTEVEACFNKWNAAEERERKQVFVDFMKQKVNLGKLDDTALITGLLTPPAAMAAKRAGENVPQLGMIKAIPDVLFVPSATLIALISVKLSRKILQENIATHNHV